MSSDQAVSPRVDAIAAQVISMENQERFASFSGDRNPVHVDGIAARRTQAGQVIAHGCYMLLWALESLVAGGKMVSRPAGVRVKFLKWVYPGDQLVVSVPQSGSADPPTLHLDVRGMRVLTADLTYGEGSEADTDIVLEPSPAAPRITPMKHSFPDLSECSGNAFTPAASEASAYFPHLSVLLSATTVAEIAACSYVVGMEAPGLHSINSKLDLTFCPCAEPNGYRTGLRYRVSYSDERFRKVRISVSGRSIAGTIEAFVRLPPVIQPSMETVAGRVTPAEFAGMRALVAGGSRGLGELTARLIAAGGGKPVITYATGEADAAEVAHQIRQWGGDAEVLRYDVRESPLPQLEVLNSPVTSLFYFATNPIFRPKGELVSRPILMDFVSFYLEGFYNLCVQLIQRDRPYSPGNASLSVYYPSSIAVGERPAGMTEYAMVKAAGEQMCRDMNQYLPNVRILTTRLPRLRTDQTAVLIPERETDSIEVLLPIIRQIRDMAAAS
jgi:acyl dehydratase/NAD(P)-dependent dehydrogenase (short-subunit alcohol dehydrogenase family)